VAEFFQNLPVAAVLADARLPAAIACAMLAGVIQDLEPGATAVPYLVSGVTDRTSTAKRFPSSSNKRTARAVIAAGERRATS